MQGSGEPSSDPFKAQLDQALKEGYAWLRFSASLEAAYQRDKAPERRRTLERGGLWLVVMFNLLLVTDWMMVPDQMGLAIALRVFFFTGINIVGLLLSDYFTPRWREWSVVGMSVLAATINIVLCLNSTDHLAPPYLMALVMVLLFNGSIVRTPFWKALLIDVLVIGMFFGSLFLLEAPQWNVMIALSLILVSTAFFILYSSYVLEHEDRTNWLMQGQEHQLVQALNRANHQLERLSRSDALTGLANRRHFDEFLAQLWQRARQSGRAIALLMMDVDHFKAYNDRYGHPQGDTCLRQLGAVLRRQLRRPGDLVARFGGEEFVAVLHDAPLPEAMAAAERVRLGVQELALPHEDAPGSRQVTLSVGVSSCAPQRLTSPEALIAAADAALYQAKSQGRNRVVATVPEAPLEALP